MIKARPEVERLKPYVAPLEGRRPLLRLDFNENTMGPSPKVVEAIRSLPPEAYSTYPEYAGLTDAFAASLGVRAEHVGAFNGVDAAIKAIFDAYGEAGGTFLTTIPTFGYYEPCAQQHGMVLDEIPYPADLSYPLEAVTARLTARPRLFFVCNPNNPTGTLLDPSVIVRLARGAPDTLVVVDELYAPFTGQSVVPAALALDNVVALHSLSKTAGLAALRLGFAVGHPSVLDRLACVTGPYDINALAVAAGRAALADPDYMRDYVAQVLAAKTWTVEALRQRGMRHFAGGGNYLLVWPPGDVEQMVYALKQRGVLVRSIAGKPVIGGSFRLTVAPPAHMQRFVAAFDDVLG
jgi:histidinol-phosphate aminotransferase